MNEEVDVKTFMDQHGIEPSRSAHDRLQQILAADGVTVLFAERAVDASTWRLVLVCEQPCHPLMSAEGAEWLVRVLQAAGVWIREGSLTVMKKAYWREAVFAWPKGPPGLCVNFGFMRRDGFYPLRQEYAVFARLEPGKVSWRLIVNRPIPCVEKVRFEEMGFRRIQEECEYARPRIFANCMFEQFQDVKWCVLFKSLGEELPAGIKE